ncbi:MAG: hypothetical protein IKV13_01025 [Akkermansia sp.]|nr:hypothetical protein [Akkermansia sp.]
MQNAWASYKEEGGFPEAHGLSAAWRVRLHQEYFDALLYRDVVERHNISHPLALRRCTPEVYYYNTNAGHEVDFLAVHPYTHEKLLVQVCARMDAPETRQRELRALAEAMKETGLNRAIIITETETGTIDTPHGQIQIISAPEFLCQPQPGFTAYLD